MIDRLPSYLTVQFVRFYYKEKEKINAKVLKVSYDDCEIMPLIFADTIKQNDLTFIDNYYMYAWKTIVLLFSDLINSKAVSF